MSTRRDRESSGHIGIPDGAWVAIPDRDRVGPNALSPEAELILGIAETFPQFQAPGKRELWQLQKERFETSGSRYRHYGINRVQDALTELGKRGHYGVRRVTNGRQPGGKADWAYARSFSNIPWEHLRALEALTQDQVRRHYWAAKNAWVNRGLATIAPVIILDEHRRKTA